MFDRRPLLKYILFQIPGLGVVSALLFVATQYQAISSQTAIFLALFWLAKDVALYPLTWRAYLIGDPTGDQRLAGRRGTAMTRIDPEGKVRLGPEIWNARTDDQSPISEGTPVRVVRNEGLKLTVVPWSESSETPKSP